MLIAKRTKTEVENTMEALRKNAQKTFFHTVSSFHNHSTSFFDTNVETYLRVSS